MNTHCPHCSAVIEIDRATRATLSDHSHFACPACEGAVPVPGLVRPRLQLDPARASQTAGPHQLPHPPIRAASASRTAARNFLILGSTALLVLGGIAMVLASRKSGDTHDTTQNVRNEILNNSYFQNLITTGTTTRSTLEAMEVIQPFGDGFIGISAEKVDWKQALELAKKTGSVILDSKVNGSGDNRQWLNWIAKEFPQNASQPLWMVQRGQPRVFLAQTDFAATAADAPKRVLLHWRSVSEPPEMALIPAGDFQMGDNLDGKANEPVRIVNVRSFLIGKTEVTKAQWDMARIWGSAHGYLDLAVGGGTADHPVQTVSWHDAVKWCNAQSEMEGLTPCYYTDHAQKRVYKTGRSDVEDTMVKWLANGYRLPTEAEWEKAARGGLVGKRFPWGDVISHAEANFGNNCGEFYQRGNRGYHPIYQSPSGPLTSPVGSFEANGYGLFDMAGNIHEWCWDRIAPKLLDRKVNDPQGANPSSFRICRGGSWNGCAKDCRVSRRDSVPNSGESNHRVGFRLVRGSASNNSTME